MLWMGEEWAASTRWPFFTSPPGAGAVAATRPGRVEEFATHGWDADEVPDPQEPRTYRSAILDWAEADAPPHRRMLRLYRQLIALREAEPDLRDSRLDRVHVDYDEDAHVVVVHRGSLRVAVNLGTERQEIPLDGRPMGVLLSSGPGFVYRDGGIELEPASAAVVEMTVRSS